MRNLKVLGLAFLILGISACDKLTGVSLKDEEFRTTQTQFSPNGSRRLLQLDYFFLSPQLLNNIDKGSCYVYKYRNKKGEPQELSETLEHRKSLPSDHYPVVLTLKNPLLKWDK